MTGSFSAGIVLCGGASRRMGRGKADLTMGDETLLGRSVRVMSTIASPVIVAAAPEQTLPPLPDEIVIVRDSAPAMGPLSAFANALAAVPNEVASVYLLGCDLPFVTSDFLKLLGPRLGIADAVVPFVDHQWHPLAALFARRVQTKIEAILAAGGRSMLALLDAITVIPLTEAEMKRVDPASRCLRNVNTPDEYADALRDAGG
jgi:molybdopterin-guanine dinucleotide biosynthesis protein A